MILHIPNARLC